MKKLITIVIVIIGLITMIVGFATPYRISGDCMEPAIKDGHLYFVNRISPCLRQYRNGDIIAFEHEGKMWISRIVALETNTVQISEGNIVVDGVALRDDICRNWAGWKYGVFAINKPLQVSADHVFVLSDNLSAQHDDSRIFGPISKNSILGLVW